MTPVSLVLFEPTPSPTSPEGWLAFVVELWLKCVSLSAGVWTGAEDALVAFDAVLLLMVLSPGDTLLLVGGAAVFVSSEESVPGLDAFEAFAGVVSSVVMSVSFVLFESTGLDALLVVLSVPVGPDWLALVAFADPVEADDALVAFDAVSLLMLPSPEDTLLFVGGTTALVFADELLSGLDASEAFTEVVSSVVSPVLFVLFELVPSSPGGVPDAFEALAEVVSSVATAV